MTIREMRRDEAALVRDLWNEGRNARDALVPGGWGRLSSKSLERIRDNLERTPAHPDALCLVAEDDEGQIVGFATLSLTGHPVIPGIGGEVEELHVRDVPNADSLRRELARSAIVWLRSRGANVVVAYAAANAPWTEEEVDFWRSAGFEIDRVILHMYPHAS